MIRIGVHNSANGGIINVIKEIEFLKTNSTQFFIHSPRSWDIKDLENKEVNLFLKLKQKLDINPVVIHSSYLISPLSENPQTVEKSLNLIKKELENSSKIADYYVLHIRENRKKDIKENLKEINKFFEKINTDYKIEILVENSASGLTSDLKNLISFYKELKKFRIFGGICLDTAHAFEGGYDIKTDKGVKSLIQDIKDLKLIKLIHLNDSKTKLASKTDRHEHLGKGQIGKEGFKNFFSFKEFKNIPLILETPKKSLNDDLKNIQTAISIIEV